MYKEPTTEQKIKLNLGCGEKRILGYINIDLDPQYKPDISCDAGNLSFEKDTVDSILASDILEHFKRNQTKKVLENWYKVLKPGGQLIIKTPNLESIIDAYKTGQIPAEEMERKIYGNQETILNCHYSGFTPEYLKNLLTSIGFKVFKISVHLDGGDWSNMGIRCQK